MKTFSRVAAEDLLEKNILPPSDYSNLKTFLKKISPEDLGEVINLCEADDDDKLEFLAHIMGLIFMNEYEVDEFRDVDFSNMLTQFYRQCIAEACDRIGVWDASEEDVRLIPNFEPF